MGDNCSFIFFTLITYLFAVFCWCQTSVGVLWSDDHAFASQMWHATDNAIATIFLFGLWVNTHGPSWVKLHSYRRNFGVKKEFNSFWPKKKWVVSRNFILTGFLNWHPCSATKKLVAMQLQSVAGPWLRSGLVWCEDLRCWLPASCNCLRGKACDFAQNDSLAANLLDKELGVLLGSTQKGLLFTWLGFLFLFFGWTNCSQILQFSGHLYHTSLPL